MSHNLSASMATLIAALVLELGQYHLAGPPDVRVGGMDPQYPLLAS